MPSRIRAFTIARLPGSGAGVASGGGRVGLGVATVVGVRERGVFAGVDVGALSPLQATMTVATAAATSQ
ncbi:MAG: hypothetical protein IIA90_01375 [Chloroflexi bacterium]|nr:hypothetical protein [Chloroflexota bacterium]